MLRVLGGALWSCDTGLLTRGPGMHSAQGVSPAAWNGPAPAHQ